MIPGAGQGKPVAWPFSYFLPGDTRRELRNLKPAGGGPVKLKEPGRGSVKLGKPGGTRRELLKLKPGGGLVRLGKLGASA